MSETNEVGNTSLLSKQNTRPIGNCLSNSEHWVYVPTIRLYYVPNV